MISPDGARQATAMWRRPRIMTPSMTAWPPYVAVGTTGEPPLALRFGRLRLGAHAAHEALDLPGGVDDALRAGVEGVTVRAELDADCRPGRAGLERVAADAGDLRVDVLGMDAWLHGDLDLMKRCWRRA